MTLSHSKVIVEHFEHKENVEPWRWCIRSNARYNHALKGLSVEVEDVDWCEISRAKTSLITW